MKANLLTALVITVFGSSAFGSGFKCEGEDGYRVKLYNNVKATDGTRTPAVLVISHDDMGTLLVRKGEEIRKRNYTTSVRYVVEGNRKLDADTAIVQIQFKEGSEVLKEGEIVTGQLVLVSDGESRKLDLLCARYLKQ